MNMKVNLNEVLFKIGSDRVIRGFNNNDGLLLICQECDSGIDYTIYNTIDFEEVDGGQFDYLKDEPDFGGYTVEELFDFVLGCDIYFDEDAKDLEDSEIEYFMNKMDEIYDIISELRQRFN